MKLLLPSNGLFGQKSTKIRIPTFADIREAQAESDNFYNKYNLVLSTSDIDPNKVTVEDADYVFTLLAFAILLNNVPYDLECSKCGNKFKHFVNIADCDVIDLKEKKFPFKKRVLLTKYSYNLLTLQQYIDAYDYAQYQDNVDTAFLDAQVAISMGYGLEHIEAVKKIPTGAYLSSFIFRKYYYHGIDNTITVKCSNCGHEFQFKFNVGANVLKFDTSAMISKFLGVSQHLSFSDFLTMSILEYNALVSHINKQVNG